MRLFVGIGIPRDVADRLAVLVAHLHALAPLRWSSLVDLHVTTKFIGEWPDDRVPDVEAALASLARAPFDIAVRGLGWFPDASAPRVFWAGVDAPELGALARDTERALVSLRVEPEARAYAPHITLARVTPSMKLDDLRAAIARLPSTDFGTFRAETFALYESRSGHHVRREFPL